MIKDLFLNLPKTNIDVNTCDLKTLYQKCQSKVDFQDINFYFSKIYLFGFSPLHDLRAMYAMVHLAPIYQGNSLLVQGYEFCLHEILFL